MTRLVANARMYAVTPRTEEIWASLFGRVARASGVELAYEPYWAPQPLEHLWNREDLGLAFMCGWPFARRWTSVQPVAAPIPAAPRFDGKPFYATDLIVRAESPARQAEETFGGRLGWTVGHSQSGYNAVRHWLRTRHPDRADPYGFVGPLVTARESLRAVLDGRVDIGPLDAYWHELLRLHEPGTAARIRTVETTELTPIPLLVASSSTPPDAVRRLTETLVGLARDGDAAADLSALGLSGFARVGRADYDALDAMAREAERSNYPFPA